MMVNRCTNQNAMDYERYGGRGITVCEEWRGSFQAFFAHIGPRPSLAYSVERIDNDKGYEPGNVCWATRGEQARNRRSNVKVEFRGQVMVLKDWAAKVGMDYRNVWQRIFVLGWSVERALTTPVKKQRR